MCKKYLEVVADRSSTCRVYKTLALSSRLQYDRHRTNRYFVSRRELISSSIKMSRAWTKTSNLCLVLALARICSLFVGWSKGLYDNTKIPYRNWGEREPDLCTGVQSAESVQYKEGIIIHQLEWASERFERFPASWRRRRHLRRRSRCCCYYYYCCCCHPYLNVINCIATKQYRENVKGGEGRERQRSVWYDAWQQQQGWWEIVWRVG